MFFRKHIPEPIYHQLPNLYVILGVAVAAIASHPVAVVASVALVGKGLHAFSGRIHHRVKKRDIGIYRRCEMAHTCQERSG